MFYNLKRAGSTLKGTRETRVPLIPVHNTRAEARVLCTSFYSLSRMTSPKSYPHIFIAPLYKAMIPDRFLILNSLTCN